MQKPPDFRRFFASGTAPGCFCLRPGKPGHIAGHDGFALLNDAVLNGHPVGSGRIAQLVEQLTLNQRVPGSSPGAPTI